MEKDDKNGTDHNLSLLYNIKKIIVWGNAVLQVYLSTNSSFLWCLSGVAL